MNEPEPSKNERNSPADAEFLNRELNWLQSLIEARLKLYFTPDDAPVDKLRNVPAPQPETGRGEYERFLLQQGVSFEERLALILAVAPHIRPNALDLFFTRNSTFDRPFTEFGGLSRGESPGFVPTGETLLFLLAGDDLARRFDVQIMLDNDHFFFRESILWLEDSDSRNHSTFSRRLVVSPAFLSRFCFGGQRIQKSISEAPARLVSTGLSWDDLVLKPVTRNHLVDIRDWLEFGDKLLRDYAMEERIHPGYTALFYGPPGTGKTLTACLLGKSSGRDVLRIDLSMVVSKWIGETEKNLSRVFELAEGKNRILFFDEADSLFGRRTETKSSNDRFANQEVAYLLQRIEEFEGAAILASNRKDDMDQAFTRRFQSIIHFPLPGASERLKLWQQVFPAKMKLTESIDLQQIAEEFEISGGVIANVSRYASIKAIKNGDDVIQENDLREGLQKELVKEGFFPR